MNDDDLLSFKEFSPVHEAHNYDGSAHLAIDSPNRQQVYGSTTTTQTTIDPLDDLINSMSTSVNVLHNESRQGPTGNITAKNSSESQETLLYFVIL